MKKPAYKFDPSTAMQIEMLVQKNRSTGILERTPEGKKHHQEIIKKENKKMQKKYYVLKNESGKYLCSNDGFGEDYIKDINVARVFNSKKSAKNEMECLYCITNIVEIEISAKEK